MRGRHNLNKTSGKVKAAISTAFHHALKFFGNIFRPKMCHRNIDPTIRRCAALAHFFINGAADNIARCTFTSIVIIEHEAFIFAIHQITASTPKPLFKNRSGHFGFVTRHQASWMKLHHFHIAKPKPAAQSHRQTIHALITRWGMIFIHCRAAASRHQYGFSANQPKSAAAHINEQNTRKRASITRGNQANCPMFLQFFDWP